MAIMEKGHSLGPSFVQLLKDTNPAGVGTGLVATLFSTLGPGVIVMTSAKAGGLTDAQAVSWLLAIYTFGGLATIFMALRYRIPLVVAYSIPGAVLLAKLLPNFTLSEAVGAYIVVGIVTLILTVTGLIKKVVDRIPVPIMLGMVGGVLFSFGIGLFKASIEQPKIYGVMMLVFFGTMAFKKFASKIPPIVVAIVVGTALLVFYGQIKPIPMHFELARPEFIWPTFSLRAIIDISIPLFFLVIGVQNIQAVGVLIAENYTPPINAMYLVPSIGAFFNASIGGHCAVTAGPSTAICSSPAAHEKHELRYVAAFYEGVFWFCFALLAKAAVDAVNMVPKEFTIVLAGIAMFDVFSTAFRGAFAGKFRYGALVAFFLSVANIPIFNVGAPLWAIIFGVLISLVLEMDDFKANNNSAPVAPPAPVAQPATSQ